MEHNNGKHPLDSKKIALFVVYGIVTLCLLVTVLTFNDLPSIARALRDVKFDYVLLALISVLIYMALYPCSLCILTRARGINIKTSTTYVIGQTEHFFNCITPLATGGQPFQAHSFYRAGIRLSESTGLLLANLLIFLAATNTYAIVGLLYWNSLVAYVNGWWIPIIIIGYSLNLIVLFATFILGASKKLRDFVMRIIYALCRFKPLMRFESGADKLCLYFEQVQVAFASLMHKRWHCLLAFLTKLVAFAFLYGSTYFAMLSMGVPAESSHIPFILFGTSFAITAVGFFPTPGASGGVEGVASQVFKSILIYVVGPSAILSAGAISGGIMLIWRLASYYFVILVSLGFYVALEIYFARRERRAETGN